MRVLHVLASNKYSGAENVACQIIKMFDGEVEMAYCSPDGEIAKSLHEKGIKFFPLQKLSKKNLKKVVEEFKPDVIHAHDLKASIISSGIKKVKVISHIHGNKKGMNKLSLKSLSFLLASKHCDQIYWVSQSCLDDYRFKNKVKNKSIVLPNIINVDDLIAKAAQDINEYNFDIVYLGRLVEEKNPHRLIRIINLLKVNLPPVKMAIIGDGVFFDDIKDKITQEGLDENVVMYGFKSNPHKIVSQSKVMLMTSLREGTPMCALESMALGVPVVSTKTDGMCQLIENGKNGYLYDTDDEAAQIIEKLLSNSENYNQLKVECLDQSKRINDIMIYKKHLEAGYQTK